MNGIQMFSHGAPCLPGSSLISHLHLTCRFGISQPNGNWERFSDLLGTVRCAYREHAAVRAPVRKKCEAATDFQALDCAVYQYHQRYRADFRSGGAKLL